MNFRYIFSIVFGLLSLTINSADNYYYYCGNKEPLTVDKSYVVAISPVNSTVKMPAAYTLSESITIEDDRSNIEVYTVSGSLAESSKLLPKNVYDCYKSDNNGPLIPTGYIYVKLKDEGDIKLLNSMAEKYEFDVVSQNTFMPLWYTIHVLPQSDKSSVDLANRLYEMGCFSACTPSFSFDARLISYDPNVFEQWNLYNATYEDADVNISSAWSYATGKGIKVAVIDEGIDRNHVDLIENIADISYDAETKQLGSKLYGDHGTHCAGIIGAVRNNGVHISGVAPDVKLISVSVVLKHHNKIGELLADGINWAWENGADIISCSWMTEPNDLVKEAIKSALTKGREGKGCIIVAASGNSGEDIVYPANFSPDVFAVGSINETGYIEGYSCYGENLLVCAPGTNVWSTLPGDRIGSGTGTSMACPHVAGVAALILQRNPTLSIAEVREIIAKSAYKNENIPFNTHTEYGTMNRYYGYGLVDAYKAVLMTPRYDQR